MTPDEGKMFCLFCLLALYIGLNQKKKKKKNPKKPFISKFTLIYTGFP